MSRGKALLKNTAILMVAKVSTQVINFLLLPLYTAVLSTIEYGTVDVITSLSMILLPFATLQLEQGIFRYLIQAQTDELKEQILTSGIFCIGVVVLIVSICYFIVCGFITVENAILIYLYYLSMVFNTVLLQVCRGFGANIQYGVGSFLASSLAVCLNVPLVAVLGFGISGILLSSIIANIISTIYMSMSIHIGRYFRRKSFTCSVLKDELNFSVPLVFNQISSWVINYSNRLIIIYFWGMGANGIFSLASKFSSILSTFFGVYNIAFTENIVKSSEDKDSHAYFSKLLNVTVQLYLCLITLIINLLPLIFSFMVNENYYDAYLHIPILIVAMFFSGMAATLGSIYIAYSRTKEIGITTALSGVVNIIVHVSLLQALHLYAASLSTMISFVVLFVYRYIKIQSFVPVRLEVKSVVFQTTILVISWIAYVTKSSYLISVGICLNVVYIILWLLRYKEILANSLKIKRGFIFK